MRPKGSPVSPESLEWWKNAFEFIGVVLLLLTFIAGAGALWFSRRLNAVQAEQLRQFDKGLTEAKTELGKQQERAAGAEGRLEELINDNLRLQSDLLKLRKESEPRRLTGSQRTNLVRHLAGIHEAVVIVSRVVDTESADFADDLNSALHDAGWETVRIQNRISSRYGVSLGTVAGTSFSQGAMRLNEALTAIGIVHDNPVFAVGDASTSPAFQSGVLYLVVEQRPPVTNP
jgi:hypothetical protein